MARDEANAELSAEQARLSAADAEHVESLPSLEAMARADLSHGAYPDLNKQRFWEITIMRVRPGHDDQFAAAAKAYKAHGGAVDAERQVARVSGVGRHARADVSDLLVGRVVRPVRRECSPKAWPPRRR